ncbi:MAG: TetR/AcrR family transcriptional regulator [Chloroflexota bacterium]
MKKQGSETRNQRLREASQQRRKQEKQEVRQAILIASTELFLAHGYHNFSLRQVAEKIGYSPGTIYLYFQDKDAILFTIMEEGVVRFATMLAEAAAATDARERLTRIGEAYIRFGVQNPAHYQLMFMQRPDYLARAPENTPQPILEIFDLWRKVVEDAMQAGVLRPGDPTSTGDILWALLHGVVSIAILMPNFDEKRIHDMSAKALEMLTSGLHKT